MVLISVIYVLLGFLLLIKGGDYLIDGAVVIARKAKLSNMVIGLTVIGFGTSAPELLVSTQAAIVGSPGLAIGNVVGSNIANIALILGITALICPLPVKNSTLFRDTPFMFFSIVLLVISGMSGTITRWEGLLGVALLVGFVVWQIRTSRKQEKAALQAPDTQTDGDAPSASVDMALRKALLIVVVSIAALVAGANLLISGASDIAMALGTALGVDAREMERIVGLTIVAVGTSFPELFATVIAARKSQADMAIGNIIGSVTFNILSVVGVASAVCPIRNSDVGFAFDYLFMLFLGIILWIFLYTNRRLDRWEGWVLTLLYIAYIARTLIVVK